MLILQIVVKLLDLLDHVLITSFLPDSDNFSAFLISVNINKWSFPNRSGHYFFLLFIIKELVFLLFLVFLPFVETPHGVTGFLPPDVLPSPPP